MILLIALIPALIVLVVAYSSKDRKITKNTAICMGLLGIFTGNPAYAALDMFFVYVSYIISLSITRTKDNETYQSYAEEKEAARSRKRERMRKALEAALEEKAIKEKYEKDK